MTITSLPGGSGKFDFRSSPKGSKLNFPNGYPNPRYPNRKLNQPLRERSKQIDRSGIGPPPRHIRKHRFKVSRRETVVLQERQVADRGFRLWAATYFTSLRSINSYSR